MIGSAMAATAGGHAALASCVTTNAGQLVCTSGISGGAIAFLVVLALIYLGLIVLFVAAYVKIVTKAGYSGWWVLIGLVPVVGLVMFLVFAFSDWPALRELRRLRAQEGYRGGPGQQGWHPGGPATEAGPPPFGRTGSAAPTTAGGEGSVAGSGGSTAGGEGSVAAAAAPAGWYPTPDGRRRYWNGTAWTDHFA